MITINSICNFLSTHSETLLKLGYKILETTPAWIALIISIVLPFLTRKLDLEKSYKLFIFQEKYKIYTEHFKQLFAFNNKLKTLLGTLLIFTQERNLSIDANELCIDLNKKIQDFYSEWSKIKEKEALIWLVSDFENLATKNDLLKLVSDFSNELDSLNCEGVLSVSPENIKKLIQIGTEIQTPISKYLKHYRENINQIF